MIRSSWTFIDLVVSDQDTLAGANFVKMQWRISFYFSGYMQSHC